MDKLKIFLLLLFYEKNQPINDVCSKYLCIKDVFCFGEELKNSDHFFCCITIRQSKIIDKIKNTFSIMVKLSYFFRVQAPVAPLWDYFSQFETIAEWDPNVVEAKLI